MSWLPAVIRWLVNFFGAAAKVESLQKEVGELKTSHAECMDKHAKSEERERNCEERNRRLESRLDDTITLLDASRAVATVHTCDQGKITKFSPGACKLFTWKEERALGADAWELFAPLDRARFLKIFRGAVESKQVGNIAKEDIAIITRNYETADDGGALGVGG